LSLQEPLALPLADAGLLYVSDVHELGSIPEVASLPLQVIPSGWLNQPAWSGPRAGVAFTEGSVSSNLNGKLAAAEVLPALSVHVPVALAVAESGPVYVIEAHESIPEVGSLPLQLIPTEALNQPL
jgi:hypothetical protein